MIMTDDVHMSISTMLHSEPNIIGARVGQLLHAPVTLKYLENNMSRDIDCLPTVH